MDMSLVERPVVLVALVPALQALGQSWGRMASLHAPAEELGVPERPREAVRAGGADQALVCFTRRVEGDKVEEMSASRTAELKSAK